MLCSVSGTVFNITFPVNKVDAVLVNGRKYYRYYFVIDKKNIIVLYMMLL